MKRCYTIVVFIFCAFTSLAQRVELGLQAGVCNYWGDLAPKVKTSESHFTAGAFMRVNLNNTWAIKAEFNRLEVSGTDQNFAFNKNRNLSFFSPVSEGAILFEYNYSNYGPFVLDKKFTSYFFAGLGGFVFNPQTMLNGKVYDLRDFQTEGKVYSKFSIAVPFGMGVKWMLNNRLALESQIGFRKTFTDYLDDVSTVYPDVQARLENSGVLNATLTDRTIELYGAPQYAKGYKRGNANHNDWYMSATISIVMRLNTKIKCARFY
jgi:hypothetical protein